MENTVDDIRKKTYKKLMKIIGGYYNVWRAITKMLSYTDGVTTLLSSIINTLTKLIILGNYPKNEISLRRRTDIRGLLHLVN